VVVLFWWRASEKEQWKSIEQRVPLVWTTCHVGGDRPWFVCTEDAGEGQCCSRRVAKLYPRGHMFACRQCCGLAHASQSENPWHRALSIASLARHCDRAIILSDMEAGRIACTRIGGPLLFGRLWERLGIAEVLGQLLTDRGFEFAVERAVFASVVHRLFVSGSDRSCEKWMADYRIAGIEERQLHHFYRAMAWLGEEIAPAGADALAPRCIKDLIEERLFERRRDLFSDRSLVFMDTTSLSFYGAGGESLGAYGHSKDHRADLMQMILAVVIDGEGRPICTEMLPGNTADAIVLLPVVDRLRERFHIGRVCVVADRGMISAATITVLERETCASVREVTRAPAPLIERRGDDKQRAVHHQIRHRSLPSDVNARH
jgi:Transposase DDE domain